MLSGSGAVRNVVASQTTVVTATVMIMRQAVAFGESPTTSAGGLTPRKESLPNSQSDSGRRRATSTHGTNAT